MKAILYVRWSSQRQSKGDSYARQTRLAEEVAKREGYEIIETVVEEGKSAFHGDNRIQSGKLAEIERRASQGELDGDVLLVEQLDRLSRQEPMESLTLLQNLTKSGLTVYETAINRKWDREGVRGNWSSLLEAFVRAGLAYEESYKKSSRVRSAWEASKDRGKTKDGNDDPRIMPRWMEIVDGRYSVIEARAAWIVQIYQWAVDGFSTYEIARRLNAEPLAQWGTGKWEPNNLGTLLKSRNALGEYLPRTKNEQGKRVPCGDWVKRYPAVIDEQTWHLAQSALSKRAITRQSPKNNRLNLFAGMAFCQSCRGPLYLQVYRDNRGHRLYCRNYRINGGCKAKTSYHYATLQEAVLTNLVGLALPAASPSNPAKDAADTLMLSISEMERRLDNLVTNLSETGSKAIGKAIASLETKLDEAKLSHKKLSSTAQMAAFAPSHLTILDEVEKLRSSLHDEDVRVKAHGLLKSLISGILMNPDDGSALVIVLDNLYNILIDKDGQVIQQAGALNMLDVPTETLSDGSVHDLRRIVSGGDAVKTQLVDRLKERSL